ncbi:periplasmic chaperone for outer membrane proteins Skp [Formosa sp. Hel1_31_208]|uniref:OmpH family outer membrane protein n=1 Tax=Formosa sp. Hel1_31_208 TaxID=1798225 RepID=UPI0008792C4A|nr:OmpH family outer membrane protein [Formosa sp. Hel1_31_208]SDR67078.1 periplasmic chaperone for outer membrane proteins Skp [Formosa sp. Hel1_31_208]
MKHLKTLLFAAILFVGTTSLATAQSKVAHINTTELVQAMPEMQAAKAEIEKLSQTYDAQYKEMVTELQNKVKQYRAEVDTKTEEENTKRAQEVQGIEQGIRQYQAQAQEDLAKKESALLKPIFEKAKAAIQKVATAKGFNYVLDSTEGGGVLVAAGTDILTDVKKELGF